MTENYTSVHFKKMHRIRSRRVDREWRSSSDVSIVLTYDVSLKMEIFSTQYEVVMNNAIQYWSVSWTQIFVQFSGQKNNNQWIDESLFILISTGDEREDLMIAEFA